MKVLFVTNAGGPDYMSDMVFHGGKKLLELYETKKMRYMYDDYANKENLYGRGFTMYCKINQSDYLELPDNIEVLLHNKFFEKIIYGSVWRCLDYFDLVLKNYEKKDIIFIDGEDGFEIKKNLIDKGIYFKREYYNKVDGVYPISFGVPEELIIPKIKEKKKIISDIIPNNNRDYKYTKETDYYNEYSSSFFAITMMKGGWDCLRHYEIMMNGCVPLFQNLENCPELTLTTLPKKKLLEIASNKTPNLEDCEYILEYTKNNLTTKNIINKIIN